MNPDLLSRAKTAVWSRFRKLNPKVVVSKKGYVPATQANLLEPAWYDLIKDDFGQGSGNELESKMKAVHSSSALAANTFAVFKSRPESLVLLERRGYGKPRFESKLSTGLRGTPPNLDLTVEHPELFVAIESKFLEPLTPKKPEFKESYTRDRLPLCEDCWWAMVEEARNGNLDMQYLDVAQLVKHYLGIVRHMNPRPKTRRQPVLVYLYWTPQNARSFDEYRQHEDEIRQFADHVRKSKVTFVSKTYRHLWQDWEKVALLGQHAGDLRSRYDIGI